MSGTPGALAVLAMLAWAPVAARADDQPPPPSFNPPCAEWSDPKNPLWQDALLGDLGGVRPRLGDYGVTFGLSETSEVFGATGGVRHGADYAGVTEACVTVDLGKRFGIPYGTINVSALQIHGRSLTADDLRAFDMSSDIEADRSTRLWEAWYQQYLGAGADIRVGQQSLDQEFMIDQFAGVFINASLGWPVLPSLDLYAGGPAYPLSSLGARLTVRPPQTPWIFLVGVFDDNSPGGPFYDDSQRRDGEATGTRFNLSNGALAIVEAQYAATLPPLFGSQALPGMYKLGGWADSGLFPDQRFDSAGLSLANPASSGIPAMHRGDFSLYALADQTLWKTDTQSLGVFARIMGAPADRNLLDLSFDGGVNVGGLLPGRSQDNAGIAYGVARVSGAAAALARDQAMFGGTFVPERSLEQFVELTYQIQVTGWWVVQPDLQFILNPGAGIANPADPTRRIGNELIGGVQTKLTF